MKNPKYTVEKIARDNYEAIDKFGASITVKSHISAIVSNAKNYTEGDLRRFAVVAKKILTEDDPLLLVDAKERLSYKLFGKVKAKYSSRLKYSVSETLAVLVNKPELFINIEPQTLRHLCSSCVAEVFREADWKRWISLERELPILAEVNPEIILEKLSRLTKNQAELEEIAKNDNDLFLGACPTINSLERTLVKMAWSSDLAVESVLCLARLGKAFPQDRETIIGKIAAIIAPVGAQTEADAKKRRVVFERLKKNDSEIANEVLKRILPGSNSIIYANEKPLYKSVKEPPISPQELKSEHAFYSKEYVRLNIDSIKGREELFARIASFPSSAQKTTADWLAKNGLTREEKVKLWNMYHWSPEDQKVSRKKNEALNRIEKFLQPANVIEKEAYLFSRYDWELIKNIDDGDFKTKTTQIHEARKSAIDLIYKKYGRRGIFDLATMSKIPFWVGQFAADIESFDIGGEETEKMLTSQQKWKREFAEGYIRISYSKKGNDWLGQISGKWDKTSYERLWQILPFEKSVWDFAKNKGRYDEYWKNATISVEPFVKQQSIEEAIEFLAEARRHISALELITLAISFRKQPSPESIFKVLETFEKNTEKPRHGVVNDIVESILYLEEAINDNDRTRLAMVEIAYLNVLSNQNNKNSAKSLISIIENDPALYCELRDATFEKENINTEMRFAIYSLLKDGGIVPGLDSNGKINVRVFKKWVKTVEAHYSGDNEKLKYVRDMIGQSLGVYYARRAEIEKSVMLLLNGDDNEAYREGFYGGARYYRNVHTVDPEGKEEISIANEWSEKANEAERQGFAETARMMRKISKGYIDEAEDNKARHKHEKNTNELLPL